MSESQHAEEVRAKLKARAEELATKVCELEKVSRSLWCDQAVIYVEVKAKELFKFLNLADMNAFREKYNIGRASYYKKVGIFEALHPHDGTENTIPIETLRNMTLGNAKQLARLGVRDRFDPVWVGRALELIEEEFEALVESALNTGESKPDATSRELTCTLKIAGLPQSRYDFCVDQLNQISEDNNYEGDLGHALETALAEYLAAHGDKHESIVHRLTLVVREVLVMGKSINELEAHEFLSLEEKYAKLLELQKGVVDAAVDYAQGYGESVVMAGFTADALKKRREQKEQKADSKRQHAAAMAKGKVVAIQ